MHAAQWNAAVIQRMLHNNKMECRLESDDSIVTVDVSNGKGIHLCNPLEQRQRGTSDLTTLVYLHEPAILNALRARYARREIYTRTGSILIAMNPFEALLLYDEATQERYIQAGQAGNTDQLPPHIFSVADMAYREMRMRRQNQSIIVSGESGAGKTETTKLMMNYLASVCALKTNDQNTDRHVRNRILDSNPILEAFGNASTLRNSNSSRFGKFIRLGFNASGALIGASVSTYLLERVRLVSPAPRERNYHIFYELCAGASPAEQSYLGLNRLFAYLQKSVRRDHAEDAAQFHITKNAMADLGLSNEQISSVMEIVAAVLHLGNLQFVPDGPSSSRFDNSSENAMAFSSKLLGISVDAIQASMTTRKIKAGLDVVAVGLTPSLAMRARDVVVKTIYTRMFDWLVERINSATNAVGATCFIGIVDIFGFEIFETNSLEQLCINFANEKLQQLFARTVFEKEQQEYIAEGVPWTWIDYPRNDDVVNLFETRPFGVFSLLDEQCVIPRGNDKQLAATCYTRLANSPAFASSKVQQGRSQFTVRHYAGSVVYSTDGFCDKNKDNVHPEALAFIKMSSHALLSSMAASAAVSSSTLKDKSASSSCTQKFQGQLKSLLGELASTNLHFVRCLKPNDGGVPGIVDESRVLDQLRCSGLLEVTQLTRLRHPVRMPHDLFLEHFGCLFAPSEPSAPANRRITSMLLSWGVVNPIVGRTKVFFDHVLLTQLHKARELRLQAAQRTVDKALVTFIHRKRQLRRIRVRAAERMLYRTLRAAVCRRKFSQKCARAQSVIARSWKKYCVRRVIRACRVLQAWIRRYLLRTALVRHVQALQATITMSKRGSTISSVRSSDYLGVFPRYTSQKPQRGSKTKMWDVRDTSSTSSSSVDQDDFYEIHWECGMLGIHFGADGPYVVAQRIHATLSTCIDIFDVSVGDRLVAVNAAPVALSPSCSYNSVMRQIATAPKPVVLSFRRAQPSPYLRVISLQSDEYEVLWSRKTFASLGIEFAWDSINQVPAVTRLDVKGPAIPGRTSVCIGDWLTHIHDSPLRGKQNKWQQQLQASSHNTLLLRFQRAGTNARRHADLLSNGDRLSDLESLCGMPEVQRWSWDPKQDTSLLHLFFTDEDKSLGLVLRQPSYRFYLEVSDIRPEGAVHRQRHIPRRAIQTGDQLVCVNHQNIRVIGHAAALAQLKYGPKPVLLTFRRTLPPCNVAAEPISQSY
ncbi:hypothetical protein Ae201684P_000072 [Aphanomyces euteiches]|uniref:Myosin motor domain-containing protein n=1 Tax=Aphanomyces euteiches TaxID=100861 RepID=A0A6G0XRC3_9STRA|nr:hypothetical protein Ae201684_002277 [Aphanomyces euteiches]KAH9086650.1 hypothetical protein Ae201684P_000072 [Aphanomyces euteiches]KAH9139804.1 hypothetical protein AeRB84_015940 [Aphanomyces euteiches]